jgi:hypothetical protein
LRQQRFRLALYGPTAFADGEARKAIHKELDDAVASYRQQAQAKAATKTAFDAYTKCLDDASVSLLAELSPRLKVGRLPMTRAVNGGDKLCQMAA